MVARLGEKTIMATRTYERLEAFMAFMTRYNGLDELEAAMVGATAIAALLALEPASLPPTSAQLNAAKLEYDALRAAAAYEGSTCPAMSNTNLWAEIAAEVAAGEGAPTANENERYEAYWALKGKIADLTALNTAVQADGDISTLAAIDYTSATPTAVQLDDAKIAWDTFRAASTYGYGGVSLPILNVNSALWVEIAAEAAA
jgi:hypothetical protein